MATSLLVLGICTSAGVTAMAVGALSLVEDSRNLSGTKATPPKLGLTACLETGSRRLSRLVRERLGTGR